jgi:uncharacterized protein
MDQPARSELGRIAQDLQLKRRQVEAVVQLLDEGNTVPFITRYRKEQTGNLDEQQIREIQHRLAQFRQVAERRQTILRTIEAQGKLSDELKSAILAANSSKRLEDLYLPYKPKKRSLATIAREKGLEPLADAVWRADPAVSNLDEAFALAVCPEKELHCSDDVRTGVGHILAERIAEDAGVWDAARKVLEAGKLSTTKQSPAVSPSGKSVRTKRQDRDTEFRNYFDYSEPLRQVPPHRVLAINRGERIGVLRVRVEIDRERLLQAILQRLPFNEHPHRAFLDSCANDAMDRLMLRSLEREVRSDLTEAACRHAMRVFARNLRNLLLQPPVPGRRVLAIDPGYRSGCKFAVLDGIGNLLHHETVFPHVRHRKDPSPSISETAADLSRFAAAGIVLPPPGLWPNEKSSAPPPARESSDQNVTPQTVAHDENRPRAKHLLREACVAHGVEVIVIGNGTACRETEELVAEVIAELNTDVSYVIVNEAGASVYSASTIGREEFPGYDATLRSAISIGRRLLDPLSELVKIEPQHLGVGLYQHDVPPRLLRESLREVVESCVNYVGVDLNTASMPLLQYVSGLNQLRARNIVEHRARNGPFRNREQLKDIAGIGPTVFTQAAGFLKLSGGDQPLDTTWIHPESYPTALKVLDRLGFTGEVLNDRTAREALRAHFAEIDVESISVELGVGVPTVRDIVDNLSRPGRDPREELPLPIFRKGILKIEDLTEGMELRGTVLNVVDFGAFIDIGLKGSGLVHISEMADHFIRSPHELLAVGDTVTVWVLKVDRERRRVSLTMIRPGQPRAFGRRPHRRPVAPTEPAGVAAPAAPPATEIGDASSTSAPAKAERPAQDNRQRRTERPRRKRPARRPPRPQPKVQLTAEALQGKAALRTFGELKALFEARKQSSQEPDPNLPTPG